MATAPVYAAQAPTDLTPMPQRTAADYGADIAPALDQVGQAVKTVQTAHQATAYAVDDANRGVQMSQAYRDAQASANPDGSGFADQVNQQFDKIYGNVQLPTDPELRSRAQIQMAQDRARYLDQAQGHSANLLATSLSTNAEQATNLQANDLSQNAPTDLAGGLAALNGAHAKLDTMVSGLAGLHPEAAVALRKSGEQALGVAQVNGYVDRAAAGDPNALATAKAFMQSGVLNATVPPEQIQTLQRKIEVEDRRQQAQAREGASQQKAQISSAIANVRAQQTAGIVVPDATLTNLAGQASAVKLDTDEFDLNVMRSQNGVNTETQSWKPQQFDAEIQRLQAEGPKASPDDQVRLHQLQAIAPARIAQFKDNPGGFAAANGAPPPQIDPEDPSTFAARTQWRQGVQAATGQWTPPLSKDEAQQWQQNIQQGTPADKLRTAQFINQWGSDAPNVLRQLEPNRDSAFAQAVAMGSANPSTMRDALNGPAAKAAMGGDAALFKLDPAQLATGLAVTGQPVSDSDTPPMQAAKLTPDHLFGLGASTALQARGAQFAQGVHENADNLYASTAQANGWSTFHPGEYLRSVQRAAGGVEISPNVWRGGFGTYNGKSVLLPATMTQDIFSKTISRAAPDDFARAAVQGEGTPVYAGGHPVTAGELKAATPVALGGGHYMFKVGNTAIRASHGGNYVVDVTRLPQR